MLGNGERGEVATEEDRMYALSNTMPATVNVVGGDETTSISSVLAWRNAVNAERR